MYDEVKSFKDIKYIIKLNSMYATLYDGVIFLYIVFFNEFLLKNSFIEI